MRNLRSPTFSPLPAEIRNTNIEIRNKSEYQTGNDRNFSPLCVEFSSSLFGFVSDFDIRISHLFRISIFGFRISLHEWTAGESHPVFRLATAASSCSTSSPNCERPSWELNPVFRHTKAACSLSTYRPKCFRIAVIPDGIEPSLSCMSRRCLRRWTTGSSCQ